MPVRSQDVAALGAWTRSAPLPLKGGAADFDPVLDLNGDARIVLLGEA